MKGRVGTNVLLLALFTAIGLLFFSYHVLDDVAHHQTGTALTRFIEEMTGAYTAAIILPIAIWTSRCVAFSARTWPLALLTQLGGHKEALCV
jgi:hypothetical protein